ncbi:MAG: carbamoyltransferase HypF [Desulfonatronovibrio sp.]
MKRKKYIVNGRVQGVGFRPFVYRLATDLSLKGLVSNNEQGVTIDIEGREEDLAAFDRQLRQNPPPLARIVSVEAQNIQSPAHHEKFIITSSTSGSSHQVLISPDAAVCPDCRKETLDPADRRFLYPFTNCTNCGPRLTITRSIPYDRPSTSMACFQMCPDCLAEYQDPLNRRFHAQPNACPVCGPVVWLTDNQGKELVKENQAISKAAELLLQGRILAIKGLGGFHLVCDATGDKSISELRARKNRPDKSLAVMVPDIKTARMITRINHCQEKTLDSMEHPIVILPVKTPPVLSPLLSPDTDSLGLMLPYTPLHLALFYHFKKIIPPDKPAALVMTSGNFSQEPISLGNREALQRLSPIADYFLLHNRDILIRCDDSVVFAADRESVFMRRARGYTPVPVFLPGKGPSVLGAGPELKNTICLTKDDQAFVSQHIGDLKNLETYDFFLETINHFKKILQVSPQAIVRDFHPDYLSSRYAEEESGLPVFTLQHHFAHTFSVMAENRFQGACLGVALDGTGLGLDRTLWGGELLLVDNATLEMKRLGSFTPVPLPGGEKAIEEPWRITLGFLHQLGIRDSRDFPWLRKLGPQKQIIFKMLDQNINSPLSSGCGRLFDAVAALLSLVHNIRYEGQGAIRLEKIQDPAETNYYETDCVSRNGLEMLNTHALFEKILEDQDAGTRPEIISRRFHLSLAHGICNWVLKISRDTGIKTVGLSGGVMQNMTLFKLLAALLKDRKLNVLVHRNLPPGDACVSLGQAVYGRRKLEQ